MSSKPDSSRDDIEQHQNDEPQDRANDDQGQEVPAHETRLNSNVDEPLRSSTEASTSEDSFVARPIRLSWADEPEPANSSLDDSVLPPLAIASVNGELFHNRQSLQTFLNQGGSITGTPRRDYRPRRTSMDYAMTPEDEAPTKQNPQYPPAPSAADIPDRTSNLELVSPITPIRTALAIDPHQQQDFNWSDEADEMDDSNSVPVQQPDDGSEVDETTSPKSALFLASQRELLNDRQQVWSGDRPIAYPANTEAERAIVRRLERETTPRLETFRQTAAHCQHELEEARREIDSLQTVNRSLQARRDAFRAENESLRAVGRKMASFYERSQNRANRLEEERTVEKQRADSAQLEIERLKQQLASSKARENEAKDGTKQAQAQVELAVKRASIAETEFEQSKIGVSVAETNIQIVQERNAELLANNTGLNSEIDGLKAAHEKLTKESEAEFMKVVDQVAGHLVTIDDLQEEDDANKKTIDDLRRENGQLRSDYTILKQQSQSDPSHDNSPTSTPSSQPQTSHDGQGGGEHNSNPNNGQRANGSDNTNSVDNTSDNTEHSEKDALIAKLEQDLKDCHSHGESVKQQLTQKQDEMSTASQTIQQLEERVAELEEQVRVLLAERPSNDDEEEGSDGSDDPVGDLHALEEQEGLVGEEGSDHGDEEGEEEEVEDPCSRCGISSAEYDQMIDDLDESNADVKHWRNEAAELKKKLVDLQATPAVIRICQMDEHIVRLARDLEQSREERQLLSDDAIHMDELRKEIATLHARLSAPPRPVSPSPATLAEQERLNGTIATLRRDLEEARRPRTRPNILTTEQLHTINGIIYSENVEMRQMLIQRGVQYRMTRMRTVTRGTGLPQFRSERTEISTDGEQNWALPSRAPPTDLREGIVRARARHDQRMRSREQMDAEKQMVANRVQTAETMLRLDLREYWKNRFGIKILSKEQVQGELWKDIPLATPLRSDKAKGKRVMGNA
ncbi:Hypothetical protein D9617_23g005480 [Elsinoe fawcettii]|nr:Hypothetical protein D9617_23g005480 [Elsinoe fawcettii]